MVRYLRKTEPTKIQNADVVYESRHSNMKKPSKLPFLHIRKLHGIGHMLGTKVIGVMERISSLKWSWVGHNCNSDR